MVLSGLFGIFPFFVLRQLVVQAEVKVRVWQAEKQNEIVVAFAVAVSSIVEFVGGALNVCPVSHDDSGVSQGLGSMLVPISKLV
jgi:hypothetical protein